MKLALFADIHSNLEAITACLEHAQALGADRYAFLGDLVGYGADPVAVLDLIERLRGRRRRGRARQPRCGGASDARSTHSTPTPRPRSTGRGRSLATSSAPFSRAFRSPSGTTTFCSSMRARPRPSGRSTSPAGARRNKASRAGNAGYIFCGHVHEPKLYYMGADGRPMPFRAGPRDPDPDRHASPMAGHRRLGRPAARPQQQGVLCAGRPRARAADFLSRGLRP